MNNSLSLNPPFSIFRHFILRWEINSKAFWILSSILIVTLSVFYIFQVNSMIKEVYLVQNYQKRLKELSQDNKTLEINFSQINSLANLENLIKELNFEKVDRIYYIEVLEGQVVSK